MSDAAGAESGEIPRGEAEADARVQCHAHRPAKGRGPDRVQEGDEQSQWTKIMIQYHIAIYIFRGQKPILRIE